MRAIIAVSDHQILDDISTILSTYLPDLALLFADSGSHCIQMVREQSPDLIIIEYHLPDLHGSKIIEGIRRINLSPIVVVSHLKDDADVLNSIEYGADEFCITPIRQLEFVAHVRALLHSRHLVKGINANKQPRAGKIARTTIALSENTKSRLNSSRAPGQCYDGFLCQLVDLWEKTNSNTPVSKEMTI